MGGEKEHEVFICVCVLVSVHGFPVLVSVGVCSVFWSLFTEDTKDLQCVFWFQAAVFSRSSKVFI